MIVEQQAKTRTSAASMLAEACAAVQFLTRLPMPALPWRDDTLARALLFFPAVGLALGALAGAVNLLLAAHLSRPIAATLSVALLLLITGALHEDGLADCADAFGSLHSRARTLDILHDSRIGTYGAVALGVSLLLRIGAVCALPLDRSVAVLAASLMLSRCAILPLALMPPATPHSGQGRQIAAQTPRSIVIMGVLLSTVVCVPLLGMRALPALLLAAAITGLSARFYRSRIGGITGDCFGATVQMVEAAVLLLGVWTL